MHQGYVICYWIEQKTWLPHISINIKKYHFRKEWSHIDSELNYPQYK